METIATTVLETILKSIAAAFNHEVVVLDVRPLPKADVDMDAARSAAIKRLATRFVGDSEPPPAGVSPKASEPSDL